MWRGGFKLSRAFAKAAQGGGDGGGGGQVVSQPRLKVETEQRLQGTGEVK